MGRTAIRNNTGLLFRSSTRTKNDISIKSLRINAYKLKSSLSGVTIIYNQSDPELQAVYGQNDLYIQLYLSWHSLRAVRKHLTKGEEIETYNKAACIAWLQTYLRSASNLDLILAEIRKHKYPYVLSGTTLF